ncbi:MAG: RsmE family RNA methyltransferase [Elusimicrobiota bacterium]
MPQFYVVDKLAKGGIVKIHDSDARHIVTVLRYKPGDTIRVFNNHHQQADGFVESVQNNEVMVRVNRMIDSSSANENNVRLIVYASLVKKDKMEVILQKMVELGVDVLVPVITKNVVVKLLTDEFENKRLRWEKIVLSAVKQCGRSNIMKLHGIKLFKDVLKEEGFKCKNRAVLMHEKYGDNISSLKLDNEIHEDIRLFIGPEGGFDEEEVELAKSCGVKIVNLGSNVFRSDSAAIVAVSIVSYLIGRYNNVSQDRQG